MSFFTMLFAAGLLGGGLYYYNMRTSIDLYRNYLKVRDEGTSLGGAYPVNLERPPKVVWNTMADLIYQPGMPEGLGATLPIEAKFEDKGIYGAPKVNFVKSNIYYPCYNPHCLAL